MASIRLDQFGGMAPKVSKRLLPNHLAVSARNGRLLSGELRGTRTPALLHTFADTTRNAVKIRRLNGSTVWFGLESPLSNIVKGPLINDSRERWYWSGEGAGIRYNSVDRIEDALDSYDLGTPTPTTALTVNVTGGSGLSETRAYTYTYVNEWGEESAPAPTTLVSGYVNGTWEITAIPSDGDFTDKVPPEFIRIYRTVTGQSSVAYFLVEEIAYYTTTYNDTTLNAEVAKNSILQSFSWGEPPATVGGLAVHPNGFMVAFNGRDLYFSEPYRPHAWPAEYVLTVEDEIVGVAIYNNMTAVLTKGRPVFISGIRPANLSPIKSESAEPCLSKSSIVSTLAGVFYASPNGLVLYNEQGPVIVTNQILSAEEWADYSPSEIKGAQMGNQYIGFYSSSRGFRYAPAEPLAALVEIDSLTEVDNVVTDWPTGQVWLLRNNQVQQWEPTEGIPMYYRWLSKEFDLMRPVNLGAIMIKFDPVPDVVTDDRIALYEVYNQQFFQAAAPLPPIAGSGDLQAQAASVAGEGVSYSGLYYEFLLNIGQSGLDSDQRGVHLDGILANQYGSVDPDNVDFLSGTPFLSFTSKYIGPGEYDVTFYVNGTYAENSIDAVELEYNVGQTIVLRTTGTGDGYEFSQLGGDTQWRWISATQGWDAPDVGQVRSVKLWVRYPDTFTGSGALAAQSASVSGAGDRGVIGSGALAAQSPIVSGTDLSGAEGTGALAAASASVSGSGDVGTTITVTVAQNPFSSTQYGQDQYAPTTYGSRTPTTFNGATVRLTSCTAYDPGGGTVYSVELVLSGNRAQSFFTKAWLETSPGVYLEVLTANADDFYADGTETWWNWQFETTGWAADDDTLNRKLIFFV